MAADRVLLLSGLGQGVGPAPASAASGSTLADLRKQLEQLTALARERLQLAQDAANEQAKATKTATRTGSQAMIDHALDMARANAAATVLGRNAQAEAVLLAAHIKALEQGHTDAAMTFGHAFDAILVHNAAVPAKFAKPRPSSGLGSSLASVVRERTVGGPTPTTTSALVLEPGQFITYVNNTPTVVPAAGLKVALSAIPAEQDLINQALAKRFSYPDPNLIYANVTQGVTPYYLYTDGGHNWGRFYDQRTQMLSWRRMDDSVGATVGNAASVVASGVKAIADAAAGAIGASCSILNNPLVQTAASKVAGVGGVGSSACGSATTPPAAPLTEPSSSGWLLPAALAAAVVVAAKAFA